MPDAADVAGILKRKASDAVKKQKSVCFALRNLADTKSTKKTQLIPKEDDCDETETLHFEEESESEPLEESESELVEVVPSKKARFTEDIYGRLRDDVGNVVSGHDTLTQGGSYVPPGRRKELAGSQDEKKKFELERMRKQLKGLINR